MSVSVCTFACNYIYMHIYVIFINRWCICLQYSIVVHYAYVYEYNTYLYISIYIYIYTYMSMCVYNKSLWYTGNNYQYSLQVTTNRKARQEGLSFLYAVNQLEGPMQRSNKLAMFCQIIARDVDHPEGVSPGYKKYWLHHICSFTSEEVFLLSCVFITHYIV